MNDLPQSSDRRALLRDALRAVDDMQAKLQAAERARTEPIAIVGMACRFPGGSDSPEALWSLLSAGTDAITEVPAGRWNRARYTELDPELAAARPALYGAFLGGVDTFDAAFFGITPREAAAMDPQHRLVLEVCWEALERAGCAPRSLAGSQTGVFVGMTASDYWQHIRQADPRRLDVYIATGNSHNAAAGRVAFTLGLQGPALAVDTACSSSLSAVHLACQSLRLGESTLALAGGVNTIHNADSFFAFHKWGFMARDGRCKTFDARADGFVRGEGCGFVALKRLSDAIADGDSVLAIIRGSAINQDGATSGFTVPNGRAQEAVIRQALRASGLSPLDVDYVEAHGTGTALGDPIELEALDSVLCDGRPADRPLVVGSIKTNLGHLESAAGIAGLMKVVLSLQHQRIPAHLHFTELNPKASVRRDALTVARDGRSWPEGERPRRAGVSSFGISGTNAHVVLEEAPRVSEPGADRADRPVHVLTVSARDGGALAAASSRLAAHLAGTRDRIADIAFTANAGRTHFTHRAAIVARSADDARRQLLALAGSENTGDAPRIGFLFAGDGSPYVGMGRELYDTSPVFRAAIDSCASMLNAELDRPLLYSAGGESPMDRPCDAQPALFAVEYALSELWRSWGIAPSAVHGHGVGEYAAACVAGALSLEEALRLAAARGRAMQAAAETGALTDSILDEFERAAAAVSASAPRIPLFSSTTGRRLAAADLRGGSYWRRQMSSTEPLADGVRTLGADTVSLFVQMGPAPTLDGAAQEGLRERPQRVVTSMRRGRDAWETLAEAVAAVYAGGAEIDWKAFDQPYARRKVTLPTYPFKKERFWIDGSAGAPLLDAMYHVHWRPQSSNAAGPLKPGTWLLLVDRQGVGEALGQAIERRGGRAAMALTETDLERQFADLGDANLAGIVHLWSLDLDAADASSADAAFARSTVTLVQCAQRLAKETVPGARLYVVTRRAAPGLHDVTCAAQSPALGAARVIALEHPELWGAAVDLDDRSPAAAADAILSELTAAAGESEVAFRGGRHVPRLTRTTLAPARIQARPDATYLITGGTGGIGLILAGWLADRGARHLAFVSRSGRPPAGAAATAIAALESRGVSIKIHAADVADRTAMAALVREIEQTSTPLRGVFHAAGVLRNDPVAAVSPAAMQEVARPKIAGTLVLDAVTRDLPLDQFVLFSSGASVWGGRGLVHYAAANQFLDAFAYARRQAGRPALAVNWGPWDAGMATVEAQQTMASMGVAPLSPHEGLSALEQAIAAGGVRLAVAKIDWPLFASVYRARSARPLLDELAPAPDVPANSGGELARELAAALPGDRHALAVSAIQGHAAAVFGLTAMKPDPAAGLSELGMDSLMAVELRDRLQRTLAVPLAATLAFDCPTIAAIAAYVVALVCPPAAAPPAPPAEAGEAAAIAALSQDEVRALLADELHALAMDAIGEEQA